MNEVTTILAELNLQNGSNHKLAVLKKHKSNPLLLRVLKLAMDNVAYTYGLSLRHWQKAGTFDEILSANTGENNFLDGLDFLEEQLSARKVTGNKALFQMEAILRGVDYDDAVLLAKILNRDLKIGAGRTLVNKVVPGLITKPLYMRCGVYSKDTAKKINPTGSFVQLKADGTYREFTIENGVVFSASRSGEEYEYPLIADAMSSYPDGHYFGELTVMVNGIVADRSTGNGLINSLAPPHEDIILDLWDYVTPEEYKMAVGKQKCKTPYFERFVKLKEILASSDQTKIFVIETHEVNSVSEALAHCSTWMDSGLEGAIWKDRSSVFRDGTNPQQLKLKLELELDVRIVGFKEGTPGTVREKTFGAILFETDDGKIKGATSGFTDAQLEDFHSRRAEIIGTVASVQCNDITKARGSETYSLSHPRFIELRLDKTETDTFDRAMEIKKMAMELS